MQNSKLVALLRSFEPADLRRFDDYLTSPYFNRQENLISLYRTLRALAPAFPADQCNRFDVWEKAHPGRIGSDQEIASEMNALLKHLEAFLGMERYHHTTALKELHILESFEKRHLDKNFKLQLKRIHQRLAAETAQNEQHFLQRYQVVDVEVRSLMHHQGRAYDNNLQQLVDYLDDFYLIARLRLTCELINRQSILSGSYDTRLAGGLMAYLRNYDHEKVPTMAAYYLVLRLLVGESSTEDYPRLAYLLIHNTAAFEEVDWRELFSYAQNYCIRQVKTGEASFLHELLVLYRAALETGNLLEHGVLSAWKYKNIASVGLQLQEYEWVESFIHAYRSKLPEEFQETAFAYNLADLLYHRGEYEQALKKLLKVEFTDVFYSLGTRKMMLMIYFEQGATEAMLSLISSFRLFLRRNQLISESNRKAYTNFVNLVHAIYRIAETGHDTSKLIAQIQATQPLIDEAWLLEKAHLGYAG
jgi:hypothetical protein